MKAKIARALLASLALAVLAGAPSLALADEREQAAQAMVTYCSACHGVGTLRFLPSTDTDAIWTSITTSNVPDSDTLWIDAIVQALSWPSAEPPEQGSEREHGKEWMPKGIKRVEIASDQIGSEAARVFLLRVLGSAQHSGARRH